MSAHPSSEIDDLIHQRVRLGILSILSKAGEVEFTRIREELNATDGNLSRHLAALEEGGFVVQSKQDRRTWISLTSSGREALRREVAALRAMLGHVEV